MTTSGTSKKAEIGLTRDGKIFSAFQIVDLPIVLVSLPPYGNLTRGNASIFNVAFIDDISETTLREGNIVQKLLKNLDNQNNTIDFDLISDGLDVKLVTIHKDGKLNLWSARVGHCSIFKTRA